MVSDKIHCILKYIVVCCGQCLFNMYWVSVDPAQPKNVFVTSSLGLPLQLYHTPNVTKLIINWFSTLLIDVNTCQRYFHSIKCDLLTTESQLNLNEDSKLNPITVKSIKTIFRKYFSFSDQSSQSCRKGFKLQIFLIFSYREMANGWINMSMLCIPLG